MRFDVITIFPELLEPFLACSIVGRALRAGVVGIAVSDLRDFTDDRHRTVDDSPYGGGPGMVMKPEPWFRALRAVAGVGSEIILLTPAGERLDQGLLEGLARLEHIVLLCGRYEGIDDRVRQRWVTREISVGDYVISGGEAAAMVLIEGVVRLLPGALGDPESAARDSFAGGLLDHRHFTKPSLYDGLAVPEPLLSGNHAEIELWRRHDALLETLRRRPDLLAAADLSPEDRRLLEEIEDGERDRRPTAESDGEADGSSG